MTALFASISSSASRQERPRKPSPGVRGLLQQLFPRQQVHGTTPEEVRLCSTDRSRLQVHPGRISVLSAVSDVHMLNCSFVLFQVPSRRSAGLIRCSFLPRCSCSPSGSGADIQFRLFRVCQLPVTLLREYLWPYIFGL